MQFMIEKLLTTAPTIPQLQENSIGSLVRHEIERLVLSGDLPAGSRLNENAIALRLGVSRGPVREACSALVESGLLDMIPNRGVFVRRLDPQDIEEVYDLRAGLTALAGSILAAKITPADLGRLRVLVDEMERAANDGDFRRFYPINLQFHDVVLQLTGNSRLIRSYRTLVKEFQLLRSHGLVERSALRASNQEHQEILAALERGDSQAAYDASFCHVQHGKQRMFAALAELADDELANTTVMEAERQPIELIK